MLTIKMLEDMPPNTVFARGEDIDSKFGLNMTNSGKQLRWLARSGEISDWAIYCHWADNDWDYIMRFGNKVCSDMNIRRL